MCFMSTLIHVQCAEHDTDNTNVPLLQLILSHYAHYTATLVNYFTAENRPGLMTLSRLDNICFFLLFISSAGTSGTEMIRCWALLS